MLIRELAVVPYEFGEVLSLKVGERDSRKSYHPLCVIRIPLGNGNIEHFFNYSVCATKECVPNSVAREVFHLMNFLEQKDWRDNLSFYAEFCDGKF